MNVLRHHGGIEVWGHDKYGNYLSQFYIGYTKRECIAMFKRKAKGK